MVITGWQGAQFFAQALAKKNLLLYGLIPALRQDDAKRQNAINHEARIDLQQSMKAEEQQASASQEN
jgi:hypothetical protein